MGFVVAVLTAVLLLNQSIKIRKKEQKSFDFYSFFQSFSEKYSFSVASRFGGAFLCPRICNIFGFFAFLFVWVAYGFNIVVIIAYQ